MFYKKHIYGDWSQIPAKRTNTKSTAWLQTPPEPTMPLLDLLLPESSPSELTFNISTSHERRTRRMKRDGHWLLY
jgi:hypothetical protein